jgi:hypothetical protein
MTPYIKQPTGIINNRQQIFIIPNQSLVRSPLDNIPNVHRAINKALLPRIINISLGQNLYSK